MKGGSFFQKDPEINDIEEFSTIIQQTQIERRHESDRRYEDVVEYPVNIFGFDAEIVVSQFECKEFHAVFSGSLNRCWVSTILLERLLSPFTAPAILLTFFFCFSMAMDVFWVATKFSLASRASS